MTLYMWRMPQGVIFFTTEKEQPEFLGGGVYIGSIQIPLTTDVTVEKELESCRQLFEDMLQQRDSWQREAERQQQRVSDLLFDKTEQQ